MDIEELKIKMKQRFQDCGNILWHNVKKQITQEELIGLQEYFKEHPEYLNERNLVSCLVHDIELGKCIECGKTLNYKQTKCNRQYCGPYCRDHSKQVREKVKETNLKRYGVTAYVKLCPQKVDEEVLKERRQKRKLEKKALDQEKRFGVKYEDKILTDQEKAKITLRRKYGVECAFLIPEIKKKREEVVRNHYKQSTPEQRKEEAKKTQNTLFEKYGIRYFGQSIKNKHAIIRASRERMLPQIRGEWSKYVIPLFDEESFLNPENKVFKWKCVKCGNEFEAPYRQIVFLQKGTYLPRCAKCYPKLGGRSNEEKELFEYVKSLTNQEVFHNYRKLLDGHEVDIYVPNFKTAIEFNGMFWHSEATKGVDYHKNKVELCEEKGVRLIQIFEDLWINEQDTMEKILIDALTIKKRVDVLECETRMINGNDLKGFLKRNAFKKSKDMLGCFYQGQLIFAVSFSDSKTILDIAQDFEHSVPEAFVKMLKFKGGGEFRFNADRSVSNPFFLKEIGLVKVQDSPPIAWDMVKFQRKFGSVDLKTGQTAFCFNDSERKIWDCGWRIYSIEV